ncbi:MAG: hypothetical protein ACK4G3_02680 [bacterium]
MGVLRKANVFIPDVAVLEKKRRENAQMATFTFRFLDALLARSFDFVPGQLTLLSVFGVGEEAWFYTSSPTSRGMVDVTVSLNSRTGSYLALMERGQMVGLRGPSGMGLPLQLARGRSVYLIAQNSGLVPLRSFANYAVDQPTEFERIIVMNLVDRESSLLFSEELFGVWMGHSIFEVYVMSRELEREREGMSRGDVNRLFEVANPQPDNALAFVAGSPDFLSACIKHLVQRNFRDAHIFVFIPRKFSCGFGICGGCKLGERYVCVDGPVYSMTELRKLPPEF